MRLMLWSMMGCWIAVSGLAMADDYVDGYYRRDGTYVGSHWRSRADGNPYNNYSYPGNVNPYTLERSSYNSRVHGGKCFDVFGNRASCD